MTINELTAKVKELKELKMLADELAAEITSIEDEIKAEMTERATDELTTNEYRIKWAKVTSSRFDSKAFKAAHADLYSEYTKTTESRRFTIA